MISGNIKINAVQTQYKIDIYFGNTNGATIGQSGPESIIIRDTGFNSGSITNFVNVYGSFDSTFWTALQNKFYLYIILTRTNNNISYNLFFYDSNKFLILNIISNTNSIANLIGGPRLVFNFYVNNTIFNGLYGTVISTEPFTISDFENAWK